MDELVALQRGVIGNRIHLIASAAYPFDSVLRTLAEPSFVLPAEGMSGQRYLPGAEVMDRIEDEGAELVLRMFGQPSDYRASLQPHSGTQANQIVFNAVLAPDDSVLSLRARDGGHISHTVVLSRRNPTVHYGLTSEGRIDYAQLQDLAIEHKPTLIVAGGSALPRSVDFARCGEIARSVGASLHADISHTATFVAAGQHPSTFPHCDFVTFNTMKNLRGPNGGVLLYRRRFESQVQQSVFPTTQGGINETNVFAKLACFLEWESRDLSSYAKDIIWTARELARVLTKRGIRLVTDGTDCHILLLDLREHELSGSEIEVGLEKLRILANRNLVPNDHRSPMRTSGLRVGVTNLAILGYTSEDLATLGNFLVDFLESGEGDISIVDGLVRKYQAHLIAPMW